MSAQHGPHRSAVELQAAVVSGEVSALQLTEQFLARIARCDPRIGAYLYVDTEGALAQAAAVDRKRARGETLGPLAGVPIALKDNLCTRGVPTTCASRILEGYVPPYDAHVVERLRGADAVMLGKLNMDEFAMGSSNESSAFGPTRNPWDERRAPGGSSGGAAAATAAGLCALSLGSDTGGSVRQPAAFCGVTAVKPTYGRVSRYGLVAFASSLDQVGPLARNARDAARLLGAIAGPDARDATCALRPPDDYEGACGKPVEGLRLGVVRDAPSSSCDAAVRQAQQQALGVFAEMGCDIVDVMLPHAEHAIATYYLIANAEASSNLSRFDGMRYGLRVEGDDLLDTYDKTRERGFGDEVKRRIMLGTYALSAGYYDAYYLKAAKVRTLIRRDFDAAFERCDAVLMPTAPTAAFGLGEKTGDPLSMYLQDLFTVPASLAGLPAVSTPSGLSPEGLPLGVQLCGRPFDEGLLLRLAAAYEQAIGWSSYQPPGFAE